MNISFWPPNPLNHVGDRITREVYAQPGASDSRKAYQRLLDFKHTGTNSTKWPAEYINKYFKNANFNAPNV